MNTELKRRDVEKTCRVPVLEDDSWKICNIPDLGELANPDSSVQNVVDHGFLELPDGKWQLWAAIRGTGTGHLIYGWECKSLESENWGPTGIKLRADAKYGERVSEDGKEHVCAPFFLSLDDKFYCYYNSEGIHLLESEDGRNFRRVLMHDGSSMNHLGGRDAMVLRIGDLYFAYSCVTTRSTDGWGRSFVIVRTAGNPVSTEPYAWSDYTIVAEGGRAGNGPVSAESPFVVQLEGYFYLFRSSSIDFNTYVYRSEDPYNFGINDDSNLVSVLPLKAPEIVFHDGRWYISDLADFRGIRLRRMNWERA